MSSSIWALFINPGDQYSSDESLQDGIFQKGENVKVGRGRWGVLAVVHTLRQAQNETDSNFSRGDMEGCAKLS